MYADDLVLMSVSLTVLQKKIDILCVLEATEELDKIMTFNASIKSSVVRVGRRHKSDCKPVRGAENAGQDIAGQDNDGQTRLLACMA